MNARAKITTKTSDVKGKNSFSKAQKPDFSQSISSPIDHILHLQITIGNQAVQRLFKSDVIQATLKIGQPGDIYEQEADRVAEQVMKTTVGCRQKAVGSNEKTIQTQDEEETIQPKPT